MPRLGELYPGICLTTEEKARKNLSVADISCRENQNTHLRSVTFFPRKSCRLCDNVEKYCGAGRPTDDNIAHAPCVLDN